MCEVGHQKLPVHHRRDKKGCEDEDAARIVAELRESTDRGGHVGDVVENVAAENEVTRSEDSPRPPMSRTRLPVVGRDPSW